MNQQSPSSGLLIVFTDAKGSTEQDEAALCRASAPGGNYIAAQQEMAKLREKLFVGQLTRLPPSHNWTILKNVGDALVLTAEISDAQRAREVEACLTDLLDAWRALGDQGIQIRIAVHYAPQSSIVRGEGLASLRTRLSELSGLGSSLDAFLSSLTLDIFGPGINRTARLAHAPSGPLFVVSQETVLALWNRSTDFSSEELKSFYKAQESLHPSLPLRGPIPLVKVKGVDSVAFPNPRTLDSAPKVGPWWIWEMAPSGETTTQTFGGENKRFQALRIVHAVFKDDKSLRSRVTGLDGADAPDEPFQRHLGECLPLHFFVDFAAKVTEVWSLYDPSDARDFDRPGAKPPEWNTQLTELRTCFLPYYVVLCSSPNEATDTIVRDASVPILPVDVGLEPVSYQIHRGVRFGDLERLEICTDPSKRVYLIMFQVRLRALRHAADPGTLFKNCPTQFRIEQYRWDVAMMGTIRGDKDGFLLISLEGPYDNTSLADNALREYLRLNTTSTSGIFLADIAPIKVYVCTPLSRIAKQNVAWLTECIRDG